MSVIIVVLFLLIIFNSCDVNRSFRILLYAFPFLLFVDFEQKTASIKPLEFSNLFDKRLFLLFFLCRWTMDEMQVEYVSRLPPISAGIYGWRKKCLYILLFILTVVVLINLFLTFWLSIALGLHWVSSNQIVENSTEKSILCFQGSIGPVSIFKNHVIFRSPVVLKDGLTASKIFSAEQVRWIRLCTKINIRIIYFL